MVLLNVAVVSHCRTCKTGASDKHRPADASTRWRGRSTAAWPLRTAGLPGATVPNRAEQDHRSRARAVTTHRRCYVCRVADEGPVRTRPRGPRGPAASQLEFAWAVR